MAKSQQIRTFFQECRKQATADSARLWTMLPASETAAGLQTDSIHDTIYYRQTWRQTDRQMTQNYNKCCVLCFVCAVTNTSLKHTGQFTAVCQTCCLLQWTAPCNVQQDGESDYKSTQSQICYTATTVTAWNSNLCWCSNSSSKLTVSTSSSSSLDVTWSQAAMSTESQTMTVVLLGRQETSVLGGRW